MTTAPPPRPHPDPHPAPTLEPAAGADPVPELTARIATAIADGSGWLPFDRYMAMALYTPGLGYYARDSRQFGTMPSSGSDFVTAPELSPLFAAALARQLAQALQASGTRRIVEFGAGSGALAAGLLAALDALVPGLAVDYRIVELSAALRARQQATLAGHGARVGWLDALPPRLEGVVVGNEVLDAIPVKLLHFDGARWFERGVGVGVETGSGVGSGSGAGTDTATAAFVWRDRPTDLRPPVDVAWPAGATVEIHPQTRAFVTTIAERLVRGAAFFIDYGFPEAEYWHPQRGMGTLMCHRGHRADPDPLADVGLKDITAHVDFTGVALAAQQAGAEVIGYTSQARFLLNCGLAELLAGQPLPVTSAAHRLVAEHEMGELFKVIGFARGCAASFASEAIGFRDGDRTHRL